MGAGRTRTAALLLLAASLLAGCGIRSTTVPVDAGPAPTRVSCAVPKAPSVLPAGATIQQVYLVCSMQITPVPRAVALPDSGADTDGVASGLIGELQKSPGTEETAAGFSTTVPGNALYLETPPASAPKGTLWFSAALDDLPSFALAQIVCTLTGNPRIAPDHAVLLGSRGSDEVRRYTCTDDLRTRPEAADTAGTPVH
ncbi:hypothetical protein ACFO3J_15090 [Streptomyces polygonati]|uniref:Lipoprotein n=1 Tax=Streptomyces polygonati TaxID=1617087 RepID=A0ABV8HR82_9ACTN